ncbi:efflux RND transporter periplasmic adaptor subunit [Magnetospira thiophila]
MTRHRLIALLRLVLPLVILVGAGLVGLQMMQTSPKAERKPPQRMARLVEVLPVEVTTRRAVVEATGTVRAARTITLQPRISGPVIGISPEFLPGGLFTVGEEILRIDDTDYALVVQQRQAALAEAQANHSIELGQQAIARSEFKLLGKNIGKNESGLVLRAPQLSKVEAALRTAESSLKQARLELSRATVTAPFDAVVETRDVNLGAQVTPTTKLATLIGTDRYWVEVPVPTDRLKWLHIPRRGEDLGSEVRIFDEAAWGAGAYRTGRVIGMQSGLEEQGRMAKLLVAVEDPLSLKPENAGQPVLLIGSYVRAEIQGVEIGPGAVLPRHLLRDDNTLWLMDGDNKLQILPVELLYKQRDWVMLKTPLDAEARIVSTDLASPVAGMPLRLRGDPS